MENSKNSLTRANQSAYYFNDSPSTSRLSVSYSALPVGLISAESTFCCPISAHFLRLCPQKRRFSGATGENLHESIPFLCLPPTVGLNRLRLLCPILIAIGTCWKRCAICRRVGDMFDLFEIFLNRPKVRIAPLARIGYTPAVVHP